jgi:hypothetical protein
MVSAWLRHPLIDPGKYACLWLRREDDCECFRTGFVAITFELTGRNGYDIRFTHTAWRSRTLLRTP